MGAVATTFIAGCLLARKNQGTPIGSLTQMGTIRLGKRTEGRSPMIKDFLKLPSLNDVAFGGWDLFPDNAYESASHAEVLTKDHLDQVKDELQAIKPMPAVFYPEYVKRLNGTHTKKGADKWEMAQLVEKDIRGFLDTNKCSRGVAVWCGSTEVYIEPSAVHQSIKS